jgi:hypothetical protein
MAEQRLHSAMAPIDVLTRIEMEEVMHKGLDAFVRDLYRGVDYLSFTGINTPAAQTLTIPGPDSGYAWSVKLLGLMISATNIEVAVFLGDNPNNAPVDNGGSAPIAVNGAYPIVFKWTSNLVVVRDNQVITAVCSAGATIGAWRMFVKQVPNEMIGKL